MEKVNMRLKEIEFTTHTANYMFRFILDDGTECGYILKLDRDTESHKEELIAHFISQRYCSDQYPVVRGVYASHSEGIIAIGHIYENMFFMKDGNSEIIPHSQVIANWETSHN